MLQEQGDAHSQRGGPSFSTPEVVPGDPGSVDEVSGHDTFDLSSVNKMQISPIVYHHIPIPLSLSLVRPLPLTLRQSVELFFFLC